MVGNLLTLLFLFLRVWIGICDFYESSKLLYLYKVRWFYYIISKTHFDPLPTKIVLGIMSKESAIYGICHGRNREFAISPFVRSFRDA